MFHWHQFSLAKPIQITVHPPLSDHMIFEQYFSESDIIFQLIFGGFITYNPHSHSSKNAKYTYITLEM